MIDEFTNFDAVEAYCGRLSYQPGQVAALHVSCTTDRFDVEVHRWGATRQPLWAAQNVLVFSTDSES